MIYYKGTCCPLSLLSKKVYDAMVVEAHAQIKSGLYEGKSVAEQIQLYKYELDIIHQSYVDAHHQGQKQKKEVGAGICYGDQGIIWWMNVLSLIELKVLKNDDMNGPSVSHKKMIYL